MTISSLSSVSATSTSTHPSSDGVLSYVQAGLAEKSPAAETTLTVMAVAETQPQSSERVAQAVKQVNEAFTQMGKIFRSGLKGMMQLISMWSNSRIRTPKRSSASIQQKQSLLWQKPLASR